ncbi:MAG: SHOCT domain-containing protein [Elusimicrobia bacterium]|nr:SHOCT domain-containing protein [Elusimicrobiota bacterium]
MIVFWILVIVGIIFISKWSIDRGKGKSEGDSALEILKKRYAKGEISKTEYEEKKKDIL